MTHLSAGLDRGGRNGCHSFCRPRYRIWLGGRTSGRYCCGQCVNETGLDATMNRVKPLSLTRSSGAGRLVLCALSSSRHAIGTMTSLTKTPGIASILGGRRLATLGSSSSDMTRAQSASLSRGRPCGAVGSCAGCSCRLPMSVQLRFLCRVDDETVQHSWMQAHAPDSCGSDFLHYDTRS